MQLTGSFVLPPGSVLQPVDELPEDARRDIGAEDGDFALSRAHSRTHSKVIDADAAALLREFEKPSTIARAVARFSQGKNSNPERLLEEALPMLASIIGAGLLVEADSEEASGIAPSLSAHDTIEDWSIVRCVQAMEDTEIYQARGSDGELAAIKIARPGVVAAITATASEASILAGLDASVTPRLLSSGEWNSRSYLVTEWFAGADAHAVCAEIRRRSDAESRRDLLRVTGAVLQAYAHLHEQGVIHGDIHPRNVLIDRREAVKIVDFGLAREIDRPGPGDRSAGRGGVGFFFEPEFAIAAGNGAAPPLANAAGEQYSLAAMLYLLVIGSHYLDFSYETSAMLQQIAEAPMVSFQGRGAGAWPDAERILGKALSKDPSTRFPSVKEFARAWSTARIPEPLAEEPDAGDSRLQKILTSVVEAARIGGPLAGTTMAAPAASLNYGSAGLGYAIHRIACANDGAELAALADLWSTRAIAEIPNDGAFYSSELEIAPDRVGSLSLYHGAAGVHLAQALIARARGDGSTQYAAAAGFAQSCRQPCDVLDLTLGRAGALLGCAFLLDAFDETPPRGLASVREEVCQLGDDMLEQLWETVSEFALIGESRDLSLLGIAHGWAGLLYAAMCWCGAAGKPLPGSLAGRLQELAACAEPSGRGLQWKRDLAVPTGASSYMAGWCNGSAGYVFLWTLAYRATGERRYLELAEGAAWHTWETPTGNPSLCCGMAGQSYALLNCYRHSGDPIWLRRARDMAHAAADSSMHYGDLKKDGSLEFRPASLYKGDAGIAVLAADIRRPEQARMPMFERDV